MSCYFDIYISIIYLTYMPRPCGLGTRITFGHAADTCYLILQFPASSLLNRNLLNSCVARAIAIGNSSPCRLGTRITFGHAADLAPFDSELLLTRLSVSECVSIGLFLAGSKLRVFSELVGTFGLKHSSAYNALGLQGFKA